MLKIKLTPIQEIACIALLSAMNIASRIGLQMLPNFKPVTTIIILSVFYFGFLFALKLTFVSTIVSNLFLGMGIWTLFQLFAWMMICVFAYYFDLLKLTKYQVLTICFVFVSGYLFGMIVSMDQLLIGGWGLFIPYYLAGLYFDTIHAVGNIFFYMLLAPLFKRLNKNLQKQSIQ